MQRIWGSPTDREKECLHLNGQRGRTIKAIGKPHTASRVAHTPRGPKCRKWMQSEGALENKKARKWCRGITALQKAATLINIEAVFEANKSFHNQFCCWHVALLCTLACECASVCVGTANKRNTSERQTQKTLATLCHVRSVCECNKQTTHTRTIYAYTHTHTLPRALGRVRVQWGKVQKTSNAKIINRCCKQQRKTSLSRSHTMSECVALCMCVCV